MRCFALILALLTLSAALGGPASSPAGVITLIPRGSDKWDYYDLGRNLGTGWIDVDYNVTRWRRNGRAELGYGEGDEATTVSFGPDDRNKYTTTYFRHTFEVDEADLATFSTLNLSLLRDDGAAVYLNGDEFFRSNLDAGAAYNVFAQSTVGGADETTFFDAPPKPAASWLHAGTNVLAVEIHQTNLTSSDVSFDLILEAQSSIPTPADYGSITPDVFTGLEEARVGATSFDRPPGGTELGWTMTGTGAVASVVDTYTDPDDRYNSHQFEVNDGADDEDVVITTELIDLRNSRDVQVSLDLRTWDESGGFEDGEGVDVSIFTSTDGVFFTQIPWLTIIEDAAATGSPAQGIIEGPENGPFFPFVTDLGLIPDDAATMNVVLTLMNNSPNEHIMFDNLIITGAPIGPVLVAWDQEGDGSWGELRWVDATDRPFDPPKIPDKRSDVVIATDEVSVLEDRVAATVTANNGGTLNIAEGITLQAIRGVTFEPESTLILGPGAKLDAGGDPATLYNVSAGNAAEVFAETTVTGTLSIEDGPAEMTVRGDLTMAAGSVYAPLIVGTGGPDENADKVIASGDITIEPGSSIEFRVSSADPFKAGWYTILRSNGDWGLEGEFDSMNLLGSYIDDWDNLFPNKIMVYIDKDLYPGDANLDAITDVRDFNVWNANKFTSETDWITGDFNGDGTTDVRDFNVWNAHKFTTAGEARLVEGQVPEPGMLLLSATGLIALLLVRRKRSG